MAGVLDPLELIRRAVPPLDGVAIRIPFKPGDDGRVGIIDPEGEEGRLLKRPELVRVNMAHQVYQCVLIQPGHEAVAVPGRVAAVKGGLDGPP